jgi:ribonuclease BN (tRNA processing enzyme)
MGKEQGARMPDTSSSDDRVALLGTKGGPAIRPGSAMPTASLLCLGGRKVVIDCGLGVSRGLTAQGMALKDLSLIFITHLHSDHYLELGPLLHTAWTAGLKTPVRVFGPHGLGDYWAGFLASMSADIALRIDDEGRPDLAALVTIHPIAEGSVHGEEGLSVTALRNIHPPLIDTFALRFDAGGKSVVFSGDTAPHESLIPFARGADLLVHEAMLEAALSALVARVGNGDERLMAHLMRSHTPAHEAARIAARADVGQLALHHLVPADDPVFTKADWIAAIRPHWQGPFHLGTDGLVIPF